MKTLLATALLATAFSANAGKLPISHDGINTFVSMNTVATVTSADGESFDSFLKRVAGELTTFTTATNFEACGALAKNDAGQYSVILTTNESHVACVVAYYSPGYTPMNVSIHSHPLIREFRINNNDRELLGGEIDSTMRSMHVDSDQRGFSKHDYEHTGYLVADGHILFQNGRGTDKVIL